MIALLTTLSTEATHESPGFMPYAVGLTALGILLFLLIATIAFGGGREHS